MSKKRRNTIIQLVIIASFLVAMWFSFGRNVLSPVGSAEIPEQLMEMKAGNYVEGQKALARVNQLHGTGIDLADAYIVEYSHSFNPYHSSNNERVTVWVGKARTSEAARDLMARMRQGIEKGGAGFSNLQSLNVAGQEVFQVRGPDGEHFFYQSAKTATEVVWLIINSPNTASILNEAVKHF